MATTVLLLRRMQMGHSLRGLLSQSPSREQSSRPQVFSSRGGMCYSLEYCVLHTGSLSPKGNALQAHTLVKVERRT